MIKKIKNLRPAKKSLGSFFGAAILLWSALAVSKFAAGETPRAGAFEFKMEFSKSEIYAGEQTFCNFVVYTPEEVIEVEVEKFPDFRGYWKDNLILRQGPIPTAYSATGNLRKAIVGSYLIAPMLGDLEPIIDPMKIVVRDPATGEFRTVSQGVPPTIKKLPPIPNKELAKFFHGAVGNLNLTTEKSIVNFIKDEPFILRFALTGEANFQDINNLNLHVPEKAEILSKHSATQGSGQYFSKVFEYTLAVHRDENLLLDPLQFLVFNPAAKKYGLLETSPIHLQRQAPAGTEDRTKEALPLLPLHAENEVRFTPASLKGDLRFIGLQALLALLFASVLAVNLWNDRVQARARRPDVIRRERWKKANLELKLGKVGQFLRLADQLAYEVLREKIAITDPYVTRSQILATSKAQVPEAVWVSAQELFQAHDDYFFAPQKKSQPDGVQLKKNLDRVLSA